MNRKVMTTYASPSTVPPVTLESIETLMLLFEDRQPARVVGVAIHPNYRDLFVANMREKGFTEVSQNVPIFACIPIIADDSVPEGEWKLVYEHTFSAKWEGEAP